MSMSLDDLEREIAHEASKKARELAAQADSQADALLAEARERVKARKAEAEALARDKAKGMYGELESSVYVQCKDALLEGIEHNVSRDFAATRREILDSFRKRYYSKFLAKIAKEAKGVFSDYQPSDVTVEGSRESVAQFVKMGYKPISSKIEGVIISSKDGKVVLNATLSSLVEDNMEAIRNMMAGAMGEKASKLSDVRGILAMASPDGKAHAEIPERKEAKKKARGKKSR